METVTIPKSEYNNLKKIAKTKVELMESLIRGINDIKEGRIKEWKKD